MKKITSISVDAIVWSKFQVLTVRKGYSSASKLINEMLDTANKAAEKKGYRLTKIRRPKQEG